VQQLANLSMEFRRPVLLLNGDSHLFGVDHQADIKRRE
jgi:hypothetical protein